MRRGHFSAARKDKDPRGALLLRLHPLGLQRYRRELGACAGALSKGMPSS